MLVLLVDGNAFIHCRLQCIEDISFMEICTSFLIDLLDNFAKRSFCPTPSKSFSYIRINPFQNFSHRYDTYHT